MAGSSSDRPVYWKYDPDQDRPDGVWLVAANWRGYDERVLAAYPNSEELEARRFADQLGYGEVVFVEFGHEL